MAARRLTAVRGFARYLAAIDGVSVVPPAGLAGSRARHRAPHIFSDADIAAVIARARMAVPAPFRQETVATLIGLLAVNGMRVGEALRLGRSDIDWDQAILRLAPPAMPDYVKSSIHGLEGGYSKPMAAATWDPVVKEIFAEYFENETEQRDLLCAQVDSMPLRILDVACGTGESTLAWRRRFPKAYIVAIDVSPYTRGALRTYG